MRRGSIQTWEPLARRQSSNMAQFSSSRSEFGTYGLGQNDIEYERKGGFFMTHKKTAIVISVFVLIIIAAGFVGAYIGSIPKEKVHSTIALIDDDIGCDHIRSSKFAISDSLSPSRYRIELLPIFENETITKLQGHVTIEFRYNESSSLSKLVLKAQHINLTKVTLISGTIGKLGDFKPRTKRDAVNDEAENIGNATLRNMENSTTEQIVLLENENAVNDEAENIGNSTLKNMENSTAENIELMANETALILNESSGVSSSTESSVKNETREISINQNEMDEEGGFLVLYPEIPIKIGEYYLEIDYEVPINDYVIYATNKSENISEKWMPVSRIEIRNFFPVFDDVKMKARFSLTLPRPVNMKIYSNMPLKNTNTLANDWVMDTFEETPPISPHKLAVAATKFSKSIGEKIIQNITINFWDTNLRPDTERYLIHMIEPVFQSFAKLFDANLSIPKLDIIGLQHSDYNSGYPGLVMIQESLYDVTNDSSKITKEYALMNLIKLIGEQWLGELVNIKNSSEIWILESSLLYLQHHLLKEISPEFNHTTFTMDVQPDVFEANGYSVSKSLKSKLNPIHSSSISTQEIYAMGACLIRMLHGVLRQTDFHAGYGSFVSRWSGDNADVKAFWKTMIINSPANEQSKGETNLLEMMDQWSTLSGYPVVTVTRDYKTGSAIVHQARFNNEMFSPVNQQLWHIPLTWISGKNSSTSLKWIKNQSTMTLQLETNVSNAANDKTWVVFNPTKSGYYRVNYDRENWKLLAKELRRNHEIFPTITRAALIDDVFSLGFARSIPYSTVFDVIQYLPKNEQDPEPWTYLLHHMIKLNLVLYDNPQYFSYQDFMVKFVSNLFNQTGLQIKEGSRLTMIAHELACTFDCPEYFSWAKENYAGFETLPGLPIKNNVPSYLYKSFLCAFAKLNHGLGWQWWKQKFANVTNREERNSLLSSLACFQIPSMLQAVLNEIVYSKSFEENDAIVILKSFCSYPAAAQTALKFVQSNWKNITRRYPKSCKIINDFLDASSTGFTSEKDIQDFQSFRDKNYESLKKVGYKTALLEAKANASVSFINSLPHNLTTIINKMTFQHAELRSVENLDLDT